MKTKLDQIQAFMTVANMGHFALAAKTLKLTPAAISKKIAELEKQLKIKLIERTTRSCHLTELGQRYYQQWQKILHSIEETEDFIHHAKSIPHGELIIETPRREYILPFIKEFQALYPKIHLKIQINERVPNFAKEKIDVLLGVSYEPGEGIVRKKIGTTRYVLVGAKSYFAKQGTPHKIQDLTQHHLIEHYQRQDPGWIPFDDEQKIYCPPSLLLNDTIAMRECAIEGLGIARLHEYVVKEALKQKKLISVLDDALQTKIPLYLYYPYSRYIEPKLRCFIDFIVPRFEI